ncbi:hypothetical protein GB937_006629 [Aspergillus fischeri]|nr:hypothetical protein GB937_006629 [Aspergillus fischeri]
MSSKGHMVNNDVDLICSSTDGNPGGRSAGWKRPLHIAEVSRLHIAHKSNVTPEKSGKRKGKEKEMEQVSLVQRLAPLLQGTGPA